MVILSEEIAREGIADFVDYFLRTGIPFRFLLCHCQRGFNHGASDTLTPIEVIPGVDMFNKLKMSQENWAPTTAIQIVELANALSAEGLAPVINAVELAGEGTKPVPRML
jgi:hypothetical protein